MAVKSQTNPYSLVGTSAELPNPASVPQGHIFHASDSGEGKVLVIDPATGVRTWDPFSPITNSPKPAAILAFGGGIVTSLAKINIGFLANAGSAISSATSLDYPLYTTCGVSLANVFVGSNTSDVPITLQVQVNGAAVGAAVPIPVGFTGEFTIPINTIAFVNSTISLKLTAPQALAAVGQLVLTTTMEFTPFDQPSIPAGYGRTFLPFAGGISTLQNAKIVGFLTNDPLGRSTSFAAPYGMPQSGTIARMLITVESNTADSATTIGLNVNGLLAASQSVLPGFTGVVEIKNAAGLNFNANDLMSVFISNNGTSVAGQSFSVSGIVANIHQLILDGYEYQFAASTRIHSPTEYVCLMGDDLLDNAGPAVIGAGLPFSYQAPNVNVTATRVYAFICNTDVNGCLINFTKNAGQANQETRAILIPPLPINSDPAHFPLGLISISAVFNGSGLGPIVASSPQSTWAFSPLNLSPGDTLTASLAETMSSGVGLQQVAATLMISFARR